MGQLTTGVVEVTNLDTQLRIRGDVVIATGFLTPDRIDSDHKDPSRLMSVWNGPENPYIHPYTGLDINSLDIECEVAQIQSQTRAFYKKENKGEFITRLDETELTSDQLVNLLIDTIDYYTKAVCVNLILRAEGNRSLLEICKIVFSHLHLFTTLRGKTEYFQDLISTINSAELPFAWEQASQSCMDQISAQRHLSNPNAIFEI